MPSTFLVRYFLIPKIYSLYHTHSHSGFPTMLECRYLSVHPSETQRSGERATQPDHEDSSFLSNRMAHTHQQQSVHTHTHTHTHNSSSFLSFRAFQFLSRNNTVACLVGTADTQRYGPTYLPTCLPTYLYPHVPATAGPTLDRVFRNDDLHCATDTSSTRSHFVRVTHHILPSPPYVCVPKAQGTVETRQGIPRSVQKLFPRGHSSGAKGLAVRL